MPGTEIQWFPGHMAKTRRLMKANLPLVDVVVEITDARVPASSRNPEMKNLVGGKPRVVVLNKCDMADEALTAEWIEYYRANGVKAIAMDCRSGKGMEGRSPSSPSGGGSFPPQCRTSEGPSAAGAPGRNSSLYDADHKPLYRQKFRDTGGLR